MRTKEDGAPGDYRSPRTPVEKPAATITEAEGFVHSEPSEPKSHAFSRVLASPYGRKVVSNCLFLGAAFCAIFGIGVLGANHLHAAFAFMAMVGLWAAGEATLP